MVLDALTYTSITENRGKGNEIDNKQKIARELPGHGPAGHLGKRLRDFQPS
jgi:hypothetical protein